MGRRPGATTRPAARVAQLEERLARLRAERFPSVVTVEVWVDDSPVEAMAYVHELESFFAKASPDTVVVLLEPLAPRPAGRRAPWTPPRVWLDYTPSRAELDTTTDPRSHSTLAPPAPVTPLPSDPLAAPPGGGPDPDDP